MNVSRREAIKTGFFAGIFTAFLRKIEPYIQELAAADEPVAVDIVSNLSAFTRRRYLANAVTYIYNESPFICSLICDPENYDEDQDDDLLVNIEYTDK